MQVLCAALSELLAAGLVSFQGTRAGSPTEYFVHGLSEAKLVSGDGTVTDTDDTGTSAGTNKVDDTHILSAQHLINQQQIQADTELLISKVGISKEAARGLAQLAAQRECSRGYVAEVVEYVTTTPGIKNPAGCVVQLIRRGESRRPATQVQQPAKETHRTLDPEKYTLGKYAFLFRPHQEEDEREESDGSPLTTRGDEERNADAPEGEEEGE